MRHESHDFGFCLLYTVPNLPKRHSEDLMPTHRTYNNNKEIRRIICQLIRENWHYESGTKHGKLTPPNGGSKIIVPTSPSDQNAHKIFMACVKRTQKI